MISKKEFDGYREIVESKDTQETLASGSPDVIGKLGGMMSVYYARIANELATVKDEIMAETFRLSQTVDEKGKPISMTRAETEAEINVNKKHEVSRRSMEYLMDGMDKISFACSARVRSMNKEGSW